MDQIKEITYFLNFPVPCKNRLSEEIKVYAPDVQPQKLIDELMSFYSSISCVFLIFLFEYQQCKMTDNT